MTRLVHLALSLEVPMENKSEHAHLDDDLSLIVYLYLDSC
jgi:hypothetical protein